MERKIIKSNTYEVGEKLTIFHWLLNSYFPFQNIPSSLDPSCKMDLGVRDCLRMENPISKGNFI